MLDDIGGLLQTALTVLTLASLTGLGLMRGTVTGLRESLKDAREEIADKDRRLTAAESKQAEQAADLMALRRVVTGEAHWTALGEQLDAHHTEASGHWVTTEQILSEIRDEMRRPYA